MILCRHNLKIREIACVFKVVSHINGYAVARRSGYAQRLPRVKAAEAPSNVISADGGMYVNGFSQPYTVKNVFGVGKLTFESVNIWIKLSAYLVGSIQTRSQSVDGFLRHSVGEGGVQIVGKQSVYIVNYGVVIVKIHFRYIYVAAGEISGKTYLYTLYLRFFGKFYQIVEAAVFIRLP